MALNYWFLYTKNIWVLFPLILHICYGNISVLISLLSVSWVGLVCFVYAFLCVCVCVCVCALANVYVVCDVENREEEPED